MRNQRRPQTKSPVSKQMIPNCKSFLVADPKKCTGCASCMMACSLVHEGKSDLTKSRIQILDDPFGCFPRDIYISVCKQCPNPQCISVCPSGALQVDTEHRNVRRIDPEKCIGCLKCINACPFEPSRIFFDPEKRVAFKCDLCNDTPYWEKKKSQACVDICQVKALKYIAKAPEPIGGKGYKVNLRGKGWKDLGLPTDQE